jgi:hypothetical protein
MSDKPSDLKPDIGKDPSPEVHISAMEPMLISQNSNQHVELQDLALEHYWLVKTI